MINSTWRMHYICHHDHICQCGKIHLLFSPMPFVNVIFYNRKHAICQIAYFTMARAALRCILHCHQFCETR